MNEDKPSELKLNLKMTEMDIFKDVSSILFDMIADKRIDKDIRLAYKVKLGEVLNLNEYSLVGEEDGQ